MSAAKIIEIAIGEIGVVEATGRNDGIPSERYMGGRREPWCGHFVAWVYRRAGHPLPGDRPAHEGAGGENPLASVAYLERALQRAGRYRWAAEDPAPVPLPGDLIFFADRRGSDIGGGAVQRHVGIVEDVQDGDTGILIHTIEGNLGNRVSRRVHRGDDPRIVGYGR